MNRGSALKWIEALETTDWVYDCCQLRFDAHGVTYGSAFGVLANFLDPEGWQRDWDLVSYTWHGSKFEPTTDALKRVKMKHGVYDPIDFGSNRGVASIHDVECSMASFKGFASFVQDHYELL